MPSRPARRKPSSSNARSPALQAGGLSIEHFGERTFRITATPAGYALPGTARRREFDVADFIEA